MNSVETELAQPNGRGHYQLNLLGKILVATVLAGLIPLVIMGFVALRGYAAAEENALMVATTAKEEIDAASIKALVLQSEHAAQDIERLLESAAQDTLRLSHQPPSFERYYDLYINRTKPIRFPEPGNQAKELIIPIYREIAFIDTDGFETIKIRDGEQLFGADLHNVSQPEDTAYLTEDYFSQTIGLPENELYVSHVTAWHASREIQPGNVLSPDHFDGKSFKDYEGVIRFSSPVYTPEGELKGILLLSLDHRHIIQEVAHIDPAHPGSLAWPNFSSGNYAYMFDNQGYLIGHPLLNRLRGLDENGELVDYMQPEMSKAERETVAFNLAYSDWLDINYAVIYNDVVEQKAGTAVTTNQAGASKVTGYAPINFSYGDYAETGIFGGVAIGSEVSGFHQAADAFAESIAAEQAILQRSLVQVGLLSLLLLVGSAFAISSIVSSPIRQLTAVAEAMQEGVLKRVLLQNIFNRKVKDEVSTLASVFLNMGDQIKQREENLREVVQSLKVEVDEMQSIHDADDNGLDADFLRRIESQAALIRTRRRRKQKEKAIL